MALPPRTPSETDAATTRRRNQRTQEQLLDALHQLIVDRGYERLTVQNILDKANVGRATFYAHFDGKDDLLAASIARLSGWLEAEWRARPDRPLGFCLPFYQHLASHRQIYQTTVVRESEVTVERLIREMLTDLVRQDLAQRASAQAQATLPVELLTHHLVGAWWASIVWWMGQDPMWPPEQAHQVFMALVEPGLKAAGLLR
jgi:AcrR family transcriptional regulator